ncbi:hypothetical protein [Elioraea sp.]|jgi:hypothetical protein|uniref:hypothetical protein n=1 Tax=Elioraea sp. TaxID=2185103 RepID=UPI003F7181B0
MAVFDAAFEALLIEAVAGGVRVRGTLGAEGTNLPHGVEFIGANETLYAVNDPI